MRWRTWPALALGLLVLVPVAGILGSAPAKTLVDADGVFLPGDVVFRRGSGLLSRAVLATDGESSFSHTGIVYVIQGEPFVVHATPGRSLADPKPVQVEPVAAFFAPASASKGAVYRLRGEDRAAGARAAAVAYRYAFEGRLFDGEFRLDSAESLYCTELVWRSYLEAGLDLVGGEFDEISVPLFQRTCLLPGRLQASSRLREVRHFP